MENTVYSCNLGKLSRILHNDMALFSYGSHKISSIRARSIKLWIYLREAEVLQVTGPSPFLLILGARTTITAS